MKTIKIDKDIHQIIKLESVKREVNLQVLIEKLLLLGLESLKEKK